MGSMWRRLVILRREGWRRGSSQITLGFLVIIIIINVCDYGGISSRPMLQDHLTVDCQIKTNKNIVQTVQFKTSSKYDCHWAGMESLNRSVFKMTSSTKPEVHNILQRRQRETSHNHRRHAQKFGDVWLHVVSEICEWTTDSQTSQ